METDKTKKLIALLNRKYILNLPVSGSFSEESEDIIDKIYLAGLTFYNNNKFQQSKLIMQYLTLLKPYNTEYWKALASTLYMDKEYQRAISCYNYLVILLPKDPYAYQHLAESYFSIKDYPSAWKNLKKAKKVAKKNVTEYTQECKFIEALEYSWNKFIPEKK